MRSTCCPWSSSTSKFLHWRRHDDATIQIHRWHGPFEPDGGVPQGYDLVCEAKGTFRAKHYRRNEWNLTPPLGLKPWAAALEEWITHREYPGHWMAEDGADGEDGHGGGVGAREYLMMEYKDVPEPVRAWIEEEQRHGNHDHDKWLFALFDKPKGEGEVVTATAAPVPSGTPSTGVENKILVFAAGAAYEVLPLWVAKGSNCEGEQCLKRGRISLMIEISANDRSSAAELLDLKRYHPVAMDNGTIAWVTSHTKPEKGSIGDKDVEFKIQAQLVREAEESRIRRTAYEKMMSKIRRQHRKFEKESRGKDDGVVVEPLHDEL